MGVACSSRKSSTTSFDNKPINGTSSTSKHADTTTESRKEMSHILGEPICTAHLNTTEKAEVVTRSYTPVQIKTAHEEEPMVRGQAEPVAKSISPEPLENAQTETVQLQPEPDVMLSSKIDSGTTIDHTRGEEHGESQPELVANDEPDSTEVAEITETETEPSTEQNENTNEPEQITNTSTQNEITTENVEQAVETSAQLENTTENVEHVENTSAQNENTTENIEQVETTPAQNENTTETVEQSEQNTSANTTDTEGRGGDVENENTCDTNTDTLVTEGEATQNPVSDQPQTDTDANKQ